MPTPGPNDIKAAFIVEDQASATLKQIDREASKATKTLEDKGKAATRTFDAMNFALNLATKGLKLLFQTLSQNQDFREFAEAFKLFAANQFDFSGLRDFTKDLNESNALDQLQKLIDKKNELAEAREKMGPDDQYLATDRERSALEIRYKLVQKEIDILNNAIGVFHRVTREREDLNRPPGVGDAEWETFKKQKVLAWADAMEVAKIGAQKLAEADKAMGVEIFTADEAMKDFAEDAKHAGTETADTFANGWHKAIGDLEAEFLSAQAFADRFAKETANTLSTNLFDAVTGKAVSAMGVLRSVLLGLTRQFTDAASASFLGAFGGLFGGGGGSSGPDAGYSAFMGQFGSVFSGNSTSDTDPHYRAKGGAYDDGVQFFARGGVVNGPTAFGHRGGVGVMGEAGPEAILPLKRGADGSLGVAGSGGANVTVNLYALDTRTAAAHLRTPEAQKAIGDAIIQAAGTRMDLRRALK